MGSRRTSVSLEAVFWVVLKDIAKQQQRTVNRIVTEIASRRPESTLASAIRVYVVEQLSRSTGTVELMARDREAS